MKFQRWAEVTPNDNQLEILEDRGSGYATQGGKDICLITQVNSNVVWAIEHRSGEIVTMDTRGEEIEKVEDLAKKHDCRVMSNDIGDYQTVELGYDKVSNRKFLQSIARM